MTGKGKSISGSLIWLKKYQKKASSFISVSNAVFTTLRKNGLKNARRGAKSTKAATLR